MTRAVFKALGTIALVVPYLLASLAAIALPGRARTRRTRLASIASFFSRRALALYGVRVIAKGRMGPHAGRLVIANHLSYVDVLVTASLEPSVFVTSMELRNTPVLGHLARLSGSLFVERRRASGLKREIEAITRALNQGFSVVLFPEGTTSNGDSVCPFKRSLFDAAIRAPSSVQPVCLRYTSVNQQALTTGTRDAVFYYGGTTFFRHFPRFLALRSVTVEVSLLAPLFARTGETRKHLADRAHDAISRAYQSPP